jgi:hypothetical protein
MLLPPYRYLLTGSQANGSFGERVWADRSYSYSYSYSKTWLGPIEYEYRDAE